MDRSADLRRQRGLVALAAVLILAASSRVTLPLIGLLLAALLLAVPMSLVIAWLSRHDVATPDGGGGDPDSGELRFELYADQDWGGVVPFVPTPSEPLPRPLRPPSRPPRALSA